MHNAFYGINIIKGTTIVMATALQFVCQSFASLPDLLMHLYTHTYTHILSQGRGGAKAVLQPLVQIYGCSTYLPSKQKIINDKLSIAASVNLNLMTLWQRL